jgi:hypothetical protein
MYPNRVRYTIFNVPISNMSSHRHIARLRSPIADIAAMALNNNHALIVINAFIQL